MLSLNPQLLIVSLDIIKLLKKAALISTILLISLFILNGCTLENKNDKQINSGIYGIITIGPITPVEKVGEINYKPYKTNMIVKSENGLNQITEFSSGDDGSFKVYLKPGSYVIESQKTSSPFPILKPIKVEVIDNQFTEINISFDCHSASQVYQVFCSTFVPPKTIISIIS